ncbi:MAG: HypC/HybG/HupF family hydrogenase formation chaperone [Anaerolineales bacterium]|nr:HypC/HybG/HupF family hydrogenase formation chaperone [Anaerolineales bacterium]MCB8936942.1 HypC/HybG/HupF family hydrogenase formation chaperone [Ardenticatenaceae bacterium]
MCLGVPGKVIEIYEVGGLKMGKVDFGGVVREACLAYVPEIEVGQYTVIHVGFAISQISEAEAMESLEVLQEITSVEEELGIGSAAEPTPERPTAG